jgi:single-strand DNA-binding protein
MFNKVILVGNLTRDVELKYLPSGTAVANFGIATNRTYKDVSGQQEQEVMFIDVKVFGRSAEIANQFLHKGKRILVEGRLAFEQWVGNDGQKRSKHVVVAEKVQFMDCKTNNGETNQARNYGQSADYAPPQTNNSQANIPEVDIDEDAIPF